MVLEVSARVWLQCDHCKMRWLFASEGPPLIGMFEMMSPTVFISLLQECGWEVDEEGAARHNTPEGCENALRTHRALAGRL